MDVCLYVGPVVQWLTVQSEPSLSPNVRATLKG